MFRLFLITIVLSYLSFCSASEGSTSSIAELKPRFLEPRFNITGTGPDDYECISARSSDYYGIGVRLGIYFSWWTAWAASVGMPDEVSTALDLNTVFLFANLVALVRCTITFVLTQLDGLILMHLAMGTIIGVLSIWGYRTCCYQKEGVSAMRNFGGIGTHFRVLCSLGTCIYAIWYWHTGIVPGNQDLINDNDNCRTVWTFMFVKVNAAGSIRIFYLFFSVLWTMSFGISLLAAPVAAWIRLRQISKSSQMIEDELPEDLQLATGLNYKQLCYSFQFFRVFSAFWLIWSMTTVEMTLNYNHVKKVLGPGGRIYFPSQLIPMILGAFTFSRLVWKKWVEIRRGSRYDVLGGESSSPSPSGRMSTSKTLMKLVTPPSPVAPKEKMEAHEKKDIDDRMLGVPLVLRLLVAYLPWLSLLPRFKLDGEARRTSTTLHENGRYHVENARFSNSGILGASYDSKRNDNHSDAVCQAGESSIFPQGPKNRDKSQHRDIIA